MIDLLIVCLMVLRGENQKRCLRFLGRGLERSEQCVWGIKIRIKEFDGERSGSLDNR